MHLRFALVSSLFLALASGCTYQTPAAHLPAAIPGIAPGALDVSDVTVVSARGPVDDETVAGVRRETASILVKAANERVGPAAEGGAVVHAHVTIEQEANYLDAAMREDGMAAMSVVTLPFGMKYEEAKVSVDVEVTRDGQTLRGHGSAEKMGGIYAHARRRALAVALDRALAAATPCADAPCVVPLRP